MGYHINPDDILDGKCDRENPLQHHEKWPHLLPQGSNTVEDDNGHAGEDDVQEHHIETLASLGAGSEDDLEEVFFGSHLATSINP
jgi:hypothetical protein